jgi:hypothetical protein
MTIVPTRMAIHMPFHSFFLYAAPGIGAAGQVAFQDLARQS